MFRGNRHNSSPGWYHHHSEARWHRAVSQQLGQGYWSDLTAQDLRLGQRFTFPQDKHLKHTECPRDTSVTVLYFVQDSLYFGMLHLDC